MVKIYFMCHGVLLVWIIYYLILEDFRNNATVGIVSFMPQELTQESFIELKRRVNNDIEKKENRG